MSEFGLINRFNEVHVSCSDYLISVNKKSEMKRIELTKGKYALVDDADYDYLNQYSWHTRKAHNRDVYYAQRGGKMNEGRRRMVAMHREIMDAPKGMDVDHKDGDGLNNQRSNLRVCTRSENSCNRANHRNSSSKYRGVHWDRNYSKWRSAIRIKELKKPLGVYDTELEAAIIWNIAARKYHGEFARPNILTSP